MKQSLKSIITGLLRGQIILIPAIFLAACGSPFSSSRATEYQIPWRAADGDYKLQKVSINSLSDPATLSSPLVRIFITPSEDNGQLAAPPAIGKFMTNKEGVRVPLDFTSMQGAAIHAHFERISDFDRAVGVDKILSWPLQISIETQVVTKEDVSNNAYFDGVRNAILILPFTDHEKSGLPLSLNGGVLAHEHFHAIFDKLVLKRLTSAGLHVSRHISELSETEPPSEISKVSPSSNEQSAAEFNNFLMRATNEGLADFWAWLQSTDTNFVGRSIKGLKECRRLDVQFSNLPDAASLKANILMQSGAARDRNWMYYQVGAQYARFFRELAIEVYGEKPSYAERVEMAQVLVRTLSEFSKVAIESFNTKELAPDRIAQVFAKNLSDNRLKKKSCELLAEFVTEGAELPESCSKFKIDPNSVKGKKTARRDKAPPLENCECKKKNKMTGLCESF